MAYARRTLLMSDSSRRNCSREFTVGTHGGRIWRTMLSNYGRT